MNRTMAELFANGTPDAEAIERFIAANEFPLVEPGNVTFVYRGEAEEVTLRRWISGLSTAQPLQPLEGTDLWALTMDLPEKSRFEYKFEVLAGGVRRLVLDALNGVLAHDPFGANSVCQGWGYERPAWSVEDPEAEQGGLHGLVVNSTAFEQPRKVQVYLPARYRRSRTYPLLVVHDGGDYLRYADLKAVLDNLIHRLEIPAMIVALIDSPDRLTEYTADPRHAQFIVEELLPALHEHYPLLDDRTARGLMGASLGGVATLHTASRYPEHFGQLLLQSGSFAFSDLGHHKKGPVFDPVVKFVNQYRADPQVVADRIYMSCGVYESLIYENRSLLPLLQAQGMQVHYEEVRDAHNWENWRDRLRQGLTWLYPGPLWMVYE
ncbi:MAG: enterochelin esterase [Xanthomonadales bacterium]|nr:enterochelin esterase [Xanthomonadales bacterium]